MSARQLSAVPEPSRIRLDSSSASQSATRPGLDAGFGTVTPLLHGSSHN